MRDACSRPNRDALRAALLDELVAEARFARARLGDDTPYALARDEEAYPQARITGAAALVGREDSLEEQAELLADPDAAVRYWAAVGLTASSRATDESREGLRAALKDPSAVVRIAAAGALARHAREEDPEEASAASEEPDDLDAAFAILREELRGDDLDAALLACRAIELLGARTGPTVRAMRQAADRYADVEGDQALFIRFSTSAFLGRLGLDQAEFAERGGQEI